MSYKGKIKSNVYNSRDGYDLAASVYDRRLKYLNSFEKDVIKKILGKFRGKKILDLGAGTGRLIPYLKDGGAEIFAVDISEKMVELLRKKFPAIEALVADSENLPFKDCSFDFVIATFLIVHLKNLDKTFREVYRVLADGGSFIVTNINQKKAPKIELPDRSKIVIDSYYHRPEDVIKILKNNLFAIEKEEYVYEGDVWINQIIKAVKV